MFQMGSRSIDFGFYIIEMNYMRHLAELFYPRALVGQAESCQVEFVADDKHSVDELFQRGFEAACSFRKFAEGTLGIGELLVSQLLQEGVGVGLQGGRSLDSHWAGKATVNDS